MIAACFRRFFTLKRWSLLPDERLIIVCTIHQPSTKVYNGFDEVMILSKGREAFTGDVHDAIPYFNDIGSPCPANTNPAEFFLDLVNSGASVCFPSPVCLLER